MDSEISVLVGTALSIGLFHTLLGPDHYLPFVALGKARQWSLRKTLIVTALCGIGHVAGSLVLGGVGIALGWALGSLQTFESLRGEWAAWALMGFGLAYGIWGTRRGIKRRPHSHVHVHVDGTIHDHSHAHADQHSHVHDRAEGAKVTPWALFIIFVLGPCETLIPLLMVPASHHDWLGLGIVAGVFAAATIVTMIAVVAGLSAGLKFVHIQSLDRWAHALAGFSLVVCGGGIKWLGL